MKQPHTLSISAKCSDLCFAEVWDEDGNTLFENDGYVPELSLIGGGDYVDITIDLITMKVVGLKPTAEDIEQAFKNEN